MPCSFEFISQNQPYFSTMGTVFFFTINRPYKLAAAAINRAEPALTDARVTLQHHFYPYHHEEGQGKKTLDTTGCVISPNQPCHT